METPWKVIAAFIGVFIAGAVFGGFFSMGAGAQWMLHQGAAAVVPAPAPAPVAEKPAAHPPTQRPLLETPLRWQAPWLLRRYAERLDLTPEQKRRIDPMIQRATEDYRRVQQNTFGETLIILHRLQQDIVGELTPEQRKKLLQWEQNQRALIKGMEQRQRELRKEREELQRLEQGGNGPNRAPIAPATPAASAEASPAVNAPAIPSSSASGVAPTTEGTPSTSGPEKQE